MSIVASEVIAAFDALPDAERDIVAAELLARYPAGVEEFEDDAFVEVANEVFLMFDAAEDEDAAPARLWWKTGRSAALSDD